MPGLKPTVLLAIATAAVIGGASVCSAESESGAPSWLGVYLGDSPDGGVEIVAVTSGGPADGAGLHGGDVLVSLNDVPVASVADVAAVLRTLSAGDDVAAEILRMGRAETRRVELAARSREVWPEVRVPVPPRAPGRAARSVAAELDGLSVVDIPDELRRHYGAPSGVGVLVTRVEEGRAAHAAGLRVGDLLVVIGGSSVPDAGAIRSALLAARSRGALPLQVVRRGEKVDLQYPGTPDVVPGPVTRLPAEEMGDNAADRIRIRLLEREVERLERRLRALRKELDALKGSR